MRGASTFLTFALSSTLIFAAFVRAEIVVPAATAYVTPDPNGARVSDDGIARWNHSSQTIVWFGRIATPGTLACAVDLQLAAGEQATFRLSVGRRAALRLSGGDKTGHATATGADAEIVRLAFENFEVAEPGYVRFELICIGEAHGDSLKVRSLVLDGPATKDAHFNLQPRRNAASVHANYPVPRGAEIDAFYCAVIGVEEPPGTFYMACGFHRGYFRMQINSPTERRIIFSVWDSGDEAVNRDKVADENRVRLIAKGPDVVANDFGNEGTGGHSHLKYPWKTGQTQRFLLTAEPDGKRTTYSGWWLHPETKAWTLISRQSAPQDGGYLRGLHSFSEKSNGSGRPTAVGES